VSPLLIFMTKSPWSLNSQYNAARPSNGATAKLTQPLQLLMQAFGPFTDDQQGEDFLFRLVRCHRSYIYRSGFGRLFDIKCHVLLSGAVL
jgi:hypothetical protein